MNSGFIESVTNKTVIESWTQKWLSRSDALTTNNTFPKTFSSKPLQSGSKGEQIVPLKRLSPVDREFILLIVPILLRQYNCAKTTLEGQEWIALTGRKCTSWYPDLLPTLCITLGSDPWQSTDAFTDPNTKQCFLLIDSDQL